ncbi:Uncharacterized protein dnm_055310 [Desulfonema magnum]|uniref:Uncharacterized protein n=1 Tax=Desulfonema magnum TaxID=45655 RepID=A0A975GQ33_9BACT|nr:Uncharacterized protein dnm_055310 [Desulfonema magnum]
MYKKLLTGYLYLPPGHKGTKSHEIFLCFFRVFVSLWRRRQLGSHKITVHSVRTFIYGIQHLITP